MRAGVFGKSYARVWAKAREVALIRCAGSGLSVGPWWMGAITEVGELALLEVGVAVVGEMSTRHRRAPEGSRTPWRMAVPSLSRTRR